MARLDQSRVDVGDEDAGPCRRRGAAGDGEDRGHGVAPRFVRGRRRPALAKCVGHHRCQGWRGPPVRLVETVGEPVGRRSGSRESRDGTRLREDPRQRTGKAVRRKGRSSGATEGSGHPTEVDVAATGQHPGSGHGSSRPATPCRNKAAGPDSTAWDAPTKLVPRMSRQGGRVDGFTSVAEESPDSTGQGGC